jgi:hypothetical protein
MPFDLSLPIYAASGLALVAFIGYVGRPKIRIRTYNKAFGGLRVMEIALVLSRAAGTKGHTGLERLTPSAEVVVYVTLKAVTMKSGNH